MTGNVAVWVQDRFSSYLNTPPDGSAGGHRNRYDGLGLRLAKSK